VFVISNQLVSRSRSIHRPIEVCSLIEEPKSSNEENFDGKNFNGWRVKMTTLFHFQDV